MIYPQNKDYFVIENPRLVENPIAGWAADGYPDCTALHTMKDGIGVVTWTTTADASGWQFLHVEESDLEAVLADIEQVKLNTELKKAYDTAKADYDAGFAYTSDATHGDPYFVSRPAAFCLPAVCRLIGRFVGRGQCLADFGIVEQLLRHFLRAFLDFCKVSEP